VPLFVEELTKAVLETGDRSSLPWFRFSIRCASCIVCTNAPVGLGDDHRILAAGRPRATRPIDRGGTTQRQAPAQLLHH
jgi:hypothetical protein